MSVEVVSVERIIPLDYEEKVNWGRSTHRVRLSPIQMSPSVFTRSLAVLLEYPYGTKIDSGSANDGFPRSVISGRGYFASPEVSLEFIPANIYIWVHKEMEKVSPERYAKMMEVAPRLDEAILNVKDTHVSAPRFYGQPDFFVDNFSKKRDRTYFDMGPWEKSLISGAQCAF